MAAFWSMRSAQSTSSQGRYGSVGYCTSVSITKPERPAQIAACAQDHHWRSRYSQCSFAAASSTHVARHAAPPPSGVYPLPERHRGQGSGRQDDPRHPRQLRRPQASEGAAPGSTQHARCVFHFTPTSCSWLNAVEGFFAKLTG